MRKGSWWWNITYNDNEIKFGNALTGEAAKVKAEMFMNRHINFKKFNK